MIRLSLWSSLIGLALSTSVWAADPGTPPWIKLDPAGGVIDGRAAMAFLPVDTEAGPSDPYSYFLDPAGCTAHYAPKANLDAEEVYPCDEWVQPSSGRYFAWLEKGWQRTPYVVHGVRSGGASRGQGMISSMPLAPAGRVALAEAVAGHSLHVLHLDSHLHGKYPQREVFRRIPEAKLMEGALLPEGPVVAFLYDGAKREYEWVSPRTMVTAGRVTTIAGPAPSKSTALFVTMVRPKPVADYDKLAIELLAGPPGEERPPDVSVPGVYHYYALWYGLEGKYARLSAGSESAYLEPVEIPLRAGKVETFSERLKPRPSLEAVLDLPVELPPAPRSLAVLRSADRELVREVELPPETDREVLQALPAQELLVSLQSPPWTITKEVDLSDGLDKTVTFAPRPILLHGTVYFGDRPHPASVIFATNRAQDELRVETDEEGRYETVLFRPGIYLIRVEIAGREGPGFVEMTNREPITDSQRLDFLVPGNRFEVEVTDRSSGEPIAGAHVSCLNRADEGPTVALESATGEDGMALLPPLRPGALKVDVQADGYLPSELEADRVEEHDKNRRLTIALEPEGERRALLLTLPDGRPAGYAEVREQMVPGGNSPWRSAADVSGRVEVPDAVQGSTLLIRHPDAAFLVATWRPGSGEITHWQLPRSQPPLAVFVAEPWGDPASFASLAVKVDGRWWTGPELAWLTRSRTATSSSGQWLGAQLPEVPLELVAWGRESASAGLAPLEAAAVSVPWPNAGGPVEIQVIP